MQDWKCCFTHCESYTKSDQLKKIKEIKIIIINVLSSSNKLGAEEWEVKVLVCCPI